MVDDRLRIALDGKDSDRAVGRFDRQTRKSYIFVALFEGYGLAGGKKPRRLDLDAKTADGYDGWRLVKLEPARSRRFCGPVVDMHEQGITSTGIIRIDVPVRLARLGLVNRRPILFHPLAYGRQDANRFFRNRTIRLGSDVQQVIAGVMRTGGKIAHDLRRRLPVVVGLLVS